MCRTTPKSLCSFIFFIHDTTQPFGIIVIRQLDELKHHKKSPDQLAGLFSIHSLWLSAQRDALHPTSGSTTSEQG